MIFPWLFIFFIGPREKPWLFPWVFHRAMGKQVAFDGPFILILGPKPEPNDWLVDVGGRPWYT